jgi:hypothetical protein
LLQAAREPRDDANEGFVPGRLQVRRDRLGRRHREPAADSGEPKGEPIPARGRIRVQGSEVLAKLATSAKVREVGERRSQRLDEVEARRPLGELLRRRTLRAKEVVDVDQPLAGRWKDRPRPCGAEEDELVGGVQDHRCTVDTLQLERTLAQATDPFLTEWCRQRGRRTVVKDEHPATLVA